MNIRTALTTTVTVGLLGSGLALAPSALASHGGGGIKKSGSCSAAGAPASWELKVKADDGALEVEAELDSNRNGQVWAWTLRDDGVLKASGSSTTVAPSGSFSINRHLANRAGTDTVVFRATHAGQVCSGTVNF